MCFFKKCYQLIILMRIHQPIGFFLLLWPALWGLWLASEGVPDVIILTIFVTGSFLMRSIGCVINDYIDQHIDGCVNRTKERPLPSGKVTNCEVMIILCILITILLILILVFLNAKTISLSIIAFILSWIYPYLKRYIYYPQIMLGFLFSWSILMGFTATNHPIDFSMCLLFIMNTIWTIIYDTQYAMVDYEDDRRIGVKSLALLCGNIDKCVIGLLQLIVVFLLGVIGWLKQLSIVFYFCSIIGVIFLFIWQQVLIYERDPEKCFQAFLNNNYVGMLIFMGIACHFMI